MPLASTATCCTRNPVPTGTNAAAKGFPLKQAQQSRLKQQYFSRSRPGRSAAPVVRRPVVVCALSDVLRQKHEQVAHLLEKLGPDGINASMQTALAHPMDPEFCLMRLICEKMPWEGRSMLIFQLPPSSDADIAALAKRYEAAGADALAVRTDIGEGGATRLMPLFTVCQAVQVPVLQVDCFLHPIQVVEAWSAGAAGVLGFVASVLGGNAEIMGRFAGSLGMDAPLEVISAKDVTPARVAGAVLFGVNLSITLANWEAAPTIEGQFLRGLISAMPLDIATVAGVHSVEAARSARDAGASALLVMPKLVADHAAGTDLAQIVAELKYATSGSEWERLSRVA